MSHATDAAIGMMDGAYFTSRKELLDFFNNLLDLNLTKIEQTCSGAVACQLTEYIFPNSVPMSRVNWSARAAHEYVQNYKLLQSAFNKNKIQKHIDVDKLIRGKYQDNLEFCQWLKAFFDQTAPMMAGGREGYDPVAVRAKGKGGKTVERCKSKKSTRTASRSMGSSVVSTSAVSRSGRSSTPSAAAPSYSHHSSSSSGRPSSSSSSMGGSTQRGVRQKENSSHNVTSSSASLPTASKPRKLASSSSSSSINNINVQQYEEEIQRLKSDKSQLQSKFTKLEKSSAELELALQTVETERDFYFEKLRGIEIMLQVYNEKKEEKQLSGGDTAWAEKEADAMISRIFKVMYATTEDNVVVDDEGNIVGDLSVDVNESGILTEKSQEESIGGGSELLASDAHVPIPDVEPADPRSQESSDHIGDLAVGHYADENDDLDDDDLLVEPVQKMNINEIGIGRQSLYDDSDEFDDDEDLLAD